jgi:hypothetical protein
MIEPDDDIAQRIASMCRMVERDERQIGVFSLGERCAVALVLSRTDLLPAGFSTIFDAIDRVGEDWFAACVRVHKEGWRE